MSTANETAAARKAAERDAAKAEAHEASKPVEIEFRGETYGIDRRVFRDLDFLEAIEDERNVAVLRRILGEDWTRFKDSVRDEDGYSDVEEFVEPFMDTINEALGLGNP